MKIGEKLKYKARRYLYQIEQNVNHNNQKKQTEVNQELKVKQSIIEDQKKYYTSQKADYDYYDIYLNNQPKQQEKIYSESQYNSYKYSDDNYYEQYPTHNEYKSNKKKNNNILGALDEIEEYLEEKMEKFKK